MKRDDVLFGPPPATLEILLDDPDEHDVPAVSRILSGLSAEQAVAVVPGLPYSIAQLLAHMNANLQGNLELIRAPDPSACSPPHAAWPQVSAEAWPALVAEFLTGLEALKGIARAGRDLERTLYPPTEDEPGWSVGYKLACSVAKHNSYHLGQIVLLRRLQGAWPPEQRGV